MKNFSEIHEKNLKNSLVITSTHFLKTRSSELDFKGNSLIKTRRFQNPKKKPQSLSATFFLKKTLIFESIKNPANPLNSLWNANAAKRCDFFPFLQERDHLNRLIQDNVGFFKKKMFFKKNVNLR